VREVERAKDTGPARPPKAIREASLGVACPMANEEENCVQFVEATLAACSGFREVRMFTVLDQVSKDRTQELLEELAEREPRLQVVWAPENRCVVDAYVRGYRAALDAGCDWILEIDAGFSHDPAEAGQFFEKIPKGYDCVFGTRFARGGHIKDGSWKRRIISRCGGLLTNVVLGTRLSDMTSGYELFSREALEMVLAKGIQSKAHFFQTEIKVSCRKLKCAEVPITYRCPSPRLGRKAVGEAFRRLGAMTWDRLRGRL